MDTTTDPDPYAFFEKRLGATYALSEDQKFEKVQRERQPPIMDMESMMGSMERTRFFDIPRHLWDNSH